MKGKRPHSVISNVDALNASILKVLQDNARLSITDIGKRVGLSGPAVSERIKKMEDEKIITGYHAALDHDKLGLAVNAFITLKSGLSHASVAKKISDIPEVLECYNITGNHCIILKVATGSTKRLEKIIESLQQLGETNTSIILSETFQKRGIHDL